MAPGERTRSPQRRSQHVWTDVARASVSVYLQCSLPYRIPGIPSATPTATTVAASVQDGQGQFAGAYLLRAGREFGPVRRAQQAPRARGRSANMHR
ncbi:hypothetical protein AcV5_003562 [Taiwanofungus camphoratus]|nr:hypothetical protein AcV5_003562 [Antrodia cinnamomea]